MDDSDSKPKSPYIPMFERFRAQLDEHHDRRERVAKASRDITAASKKIIFGLQRVRNVSKPIPPAVKKSYAQHEMVLKTHYENVAEELQGLNAFRYQSQITGGHQEFLEAATFQHYLETQQLLSYKDACAKLRELGGPDNPIMLTPGDYLLGILDMTGELMRFAITTMATTGELPGFKAPGREQSQHQSEELEHSVLDDMRELSGYLERFNSEDSFLARDMSRKMPVTRQSVEKVEYAVYGVIVRGSERPKGWMPDAGTAAREEVDS